MEVRAVLACLCLLLAAAQAGGGAGPPQQGPESLTAEGDAGEGEKEQQKSVISETQSIDPGNSSKSNIAPDSTDSNPRKDANDAYVKLSVDSITSLRDSTAGQHPRKDANDAYVKLSVDSITSLRDNIAGGVEKSYIHNEETNQDKSDSITATENIREPQSKLLKVEAKEHTLQTDDQLASQTDPNGSPDPGIDGPLKRVLLVALGGGDDELFAAGAAELLLRSGHPVAVLVYGAVREAAFPAGARVLVVPFSPSDPLLGAGVSGADGAGSREWAAGRVVWSRLEACAGLPRLEEQVAELQPALIVTPLWLHDVCILALARRLNIPAIGVITSRVGAWWAWTQLGALPDLASASAPTGSVGESGLFARASNLAQHYAFVASIRQRWQAPALASLPREWGDQPSLPVLYKALQRVLVVWDPLLHPSPPHTPAAVPVGGFAADLTPITKDVLVPALLNRAGVVVVTVGGREVWAGAAAVAALYRTLAPLSFTVLWGGPHPNQRPDVPVGAEAEEATAFQVNAKFIFKDHIPLNGVLGHPRHRLLISCCGEIDVMAAAHFASPVLCLPVTTDQMLAAEHLSRLGLAEVVPAWEASEDTLNKALRNLFKDRRYRVAARALAEELHDTPLSPADRLLFHVQHALRRPNSTRYHIHGSQLFLLQQGNADVYLLVLLLFALMTGGIMAAALAYGPILLKKSKKKAD